MKFWRYIRWCLGREHYWVGSDGEEIQVPWCSTCCKFAFDCRDKSWHRDRFWGNSRPTTKDQYTKDKDRACANCEKVELNETGPTHQKEIAAHRIKSRKEISAHKMKLEKERADRQKAMELKAALSEPHERALSDEEKEVEETLRRAGIPSLAKERA